MLRKERRGILKQSSYPEHTVLIEAPVANAAARCNMITWRRIHITTPDHPGGSDPPICIGTIRGDCCGRRRKNLAAVVRASEPLNLPQVQVLPKNKTWAVAGWTGFLMAAYLPQKAKWKPAEAF